MATPNLLSAFRNYLVDQELVRIPSVAGDAHPLWLEPRDGAPAPGEGESAATIDDELVLSAFLAAPIPRGPFESELRTDVIDVWLRCANPPTVAHDFEPLLRTAIIGGAVGDNRNWDMAGVRIIESLEWRGMQRLGSGPQGFTYVVSYLFERYVEQP